MAITCDVWLNEKDAVGTFAFDCLPRVGETVSLPTDDREGFRHYRVDDVTHRAEGAKYPSATYLFVSKAR